MVKKLPELRRAKRPEQGRVKDRPIPVPAKKPAAAENPVAPKPPKASSPTASEKRTEVMGHRPAVTAGKAAVPVVIPAAVPAVAAKHDTITPHQRQARKIVDKHAIWSSAFGLLPVPLADIAAISGTQVNMVAALSRHYGVRFSKNWIRAILGAIVGSVAPLAATRGIISLCKGIPGVGLGLGLAGLAGLSYVSTHTLGILFIEHFEKGGNLSDVDSAGMRQSFKENVKKA